MSEALSLGALASRGEMVPCLTERTGFEMSCFGIIRRVLGVPRARLLCFEAPSLLIIDMIEVYHISCLSPVSPIRNDRADEAFAQVRGATGAAGKALAKGTEELQKARQAIDWPPVSELSSSDFWGEGTCQAFWSLSRKQCRFSTSQVASRLPESGSLMGTIIGYQSPVFLVARPLPGGDVVKFSDDGNMPGCPGLGLCFSQHSGKHT